ncbi:hypothetical protein Avbf_13005 [Armadillidium vulgare]|nr:hypothetical protein Avbf_13005 [Armadillidium vulgare]
MKIIKVVNMYNKNWSQSVRSMISFNILENFKDFTETKKEQRKNDPWSKYMDEVKKYKQQSCTDDKSSRTL